VIPFKNRASIGVPTLATRASHADVIFHKSLILWTIYLDATLSETYPAAEVVATITHFRAYSSISDAGVALATEVTLWELLQRVYTHIVYLPYCFGDGLYKLLIHS